MSEENLATAIGEYLGNKREFDDYIRGTDEFEAILGYTGILVRELGKEVGISVEFHKDHKVRYRLKGVEVTPGVWISQQDALKILMEADQRIHGDMYKLIQSEPANKKPI